MKKKIHPDLHVVTFKCASCGASYKIESTLRQDVVNLDVCANCHPFYKGGLGEQKVKGRAEKLSSKFTQGKETITAKPKKVIKTRKTKNKSFKTLDEISEDIK